MLLKPAPEEKLDPRVKRTRILIEQTFSKLLSQKGFSAITVQNIADEAEINRATFYAHYPDKFVLLETIMRTKFKELMDSKSLSTCHYERHNLAALMVTVCEFIQLSSKNCLGIDNQYESLVENQVRKHVQVILLNWVKQIWPNQPDALNTRAVAATWAMYGLAQHWVNDRALNAMSPEIYTESVLPYISASLHATNQSLG